MVAPRARIRRTYSKEEITNIVCSIHSQPDIRKVKAVAEANKQQTDDMVSHQLLKVLARLLHPQQQHDGLLRPVRRLEEIVELEVGRQRAVREALVHASDVKVPHRRTAHDVHARRPRAPKVDGRVHLLHEAGLLGARAQPAVYREGAQQHLHDELASEGQNHDVEGQERVVPVAFAVFVLGAGGAAGGDGLLVGEEDEAVDDVGLGWVDGVEGGEDAEDGERCHPGVFQGDVLPSSQ